MMGRPRADPEENRDPDQGIPFRQRLTSKRRLENSLEELQPLENGDTDEKKGVFITT
jgi:hypothetical protein